MCVGGCFLEEEPTEVGPVGVASGRKGGWTYVCFCRETSGRCQKEFHCDFPAPLNVYF